MVLVEESYTKVLTNEINLAEINNVLDNVDYILEESKKEFSLEDCFTEKKFLFFNIKVKDSTLKGVDKPFIKLCKKSPFLSSRLKWHLYYHEDDLSPLNKSDYTPFEFNEKYLRLYNLLQTLSKVEEVYLTFSDFRFLSEYILT